ncbi:MAG: hypothetical protein ACR2IE_04275 [Candidatus Sumerlaeaceae bacterium]
MGLFRKHPKPPIVRVPTKDLKLPEDPPPLDPRFSELLDQAVAGQVGVYYAQIPLASIYPKDPAYAVRPQPWDATVIPSLLQQSAESELPPMWVYQQGEQFIMSDDYPTYKAACFGKLKLVPCLVFGVPSGPGIQNIEGPCPDVRKLVGLSS